MSNAGKFWYRAPFGRGFYTFIPGRPLGKILISAAQIAHSLKHKGKHSVCLFLGKPQEVFWLGCFPACWLVVWLPNFFISDSCGTSSPLELCRDDTAHLRPEESRDVILLLLALCGSPTASVWSMGNSELQLGDSLPELLSLWWN